MTAPPTRDPLEKALLPERFLFAAFLSLLLLATIVARGHFDTGLLLAVYGGANASALGFWKCISLIGSYWVLPAGVVLGSVLLAWGRRRNAAIWLAGGWAMTCATTETLKWLVARGRPPVPFLAASIGTSFPSGHAAASAFAFLYLWILLAGSTFLRHRGPWAAGLRELLSTLLAALPALIGYSRVYLGVHWPSDVLAGWAVGFFTLSIAVLGTPREQSSPAVSLQKTEVRS